jgi:hypothetical protein
MLSKDRLGEEQKAYGWRRPQIESGAYMAEQTYNELGMYTHAQDPPTGKILELDIPYEDKLHLSHDKRAYNQVINLDNVQRFTGPVLKSMKIGTFFKSKMNDKKHYIFPYIAMVSAEAICKNCSNITGRKGDNCVQKCFTSQCNACKYFGHTKSQCYNDKSYPNK